MMQQPPTPDKDAYALLELPRGPLSSSDEIRIQFKRLAVSCHPDKIGALPDSQRAEAAQRYSAIHRAYQVLSNPIMRAVYHTSSYRGVDNFNALLNHSEWRQKHPGQDPAVDNGFLQPMVVGPVPLSARMVMYGGWLPVSYITQQLCGACFGRGCPWKPSASNSFTWSHLLCDTCTGTGTVSIVHASTGAVARVTCHTCGGLGKHQHGRDICATCSGAQSMSCAVKIFVWINPGETRTSIEVVGLGSQLPGMAFRQPVLIQLQSKIPTYSAALYQDAANAVKAGHLVWSRSGNDLHVHVPLPLIQLYTGIRTSVGHLDGRVINLVSSPVASHHIACTLSCVVKGEGVRRPDEKTIMKFGLHRTLVKVVGVDVPPNTVPDKLPIVPVPFGHLFVTFHIQLPTLVDHEFVHSQRELINLCNDAAQCMTHPVYRVTHGPHGGGVQVSSLSSGQRSGGDSLSILTNDNLQESKHKADDSPESSSSSSKSSSPDMNQPYVDEQDVDDDDQHADEQYHADMDTEDGSIIDSK